MALDEDTITDRVLTVGQFALVCATDSDPRHRTVRVYLMTGDPDARKPLPDASKLEGEFICSYYLSTLIKRALEADRANGFTLAGRRHTILAEDWPSVEAWLRVMAR